MSIVEGVLSGDSEERGVPISGVRRFPRYWHTQSVTELEYDFLLKLYTCHGKMFSGDMKE
jgi:hypothetical protein